MKKSILLLVSGILFSFISHAQNPYIDCSQDVFYAIGWGNHNIYKLSKANGTVTVDSTVVPQSTGNQLGLAIASVSGVNRFYSGGTTSTSAYNILEYSNGGWNNVFSNSFPNVFSNAAGYGGNVYYQKLAVGSDPVNRIYKYDGSSLTIFWEDSSMFMTVADIAVDSAGSIYVFTGAQQGITDTLRVFASNGAQSAAYPVSFPGTLCYGLFIDGGTLYMGVGPGNPNWQNAIVPMSITGGQVIFGTPMAVPHPVIGGTIGNPQFLEFSDLASCNSGVIINNDVSSVEDIFNKYYITAFPNPSEDAITINGIFPKQSDLMVYSLTGVLVKQGKINPGDKLNVSDLSSGVYMLKLGNEAVLKFIRE